MIDGNELTGSIPTEVGVLTKLKSLCLGKHLFSVLLLYSKPKQMRSMFLTYLHFCCFIADNELKGSIPSELGSVIYLEALDLGMYIFKLNQI